MNINQILKFASIYKKASRDSFEFDTTDIGVKESNIHGIGAFSRVHADPGSTFDTTGLNFRGFNHSDNPNVKLRLKSRYENFGFENDLTQDWALESDNVVVVVREVNPGDELLVQYDAPPYLGE